MATFKKRLLSGSDDGKAIKIAAIATAGTLIHTAVAGQVAGTYDEIWLWAYNYNESMVILTLEWGGVSVPDNITRYYLPGGAVEIPLKSGKILQNGLVVGAFATKANVITIDGFVNQITD